ncbi:tyrosine-type recombinase/integrase [Streptomyces sp. NPDC058369]|uniref:tyrosine-type recombinase/integrase n=1 Tax=Streptomyces sp. NPDC058369 TaxID=3346462 RepID=UPI0036665FEA
MSDARCATCSFATAASRVPTTSFANPLRSICQELGILNGVGKPAIHPHRFRHTLGTQLAEKGARMQTIMKVLGHKSPGMSMTYTHISDPTVLADYQAVLKPGAVIAGPLADTLRSGQLDQDALDWLKTNFYKTELELGRCLRLPQEGPCECDLYLSCAKFITTPQYAPRLRERLCVERQLIADAQDRGWDREIERHQRVADRITSLLDDLGESHDEPTG